MQRAMAEIAADPEAIVRYQVTLSLSSATLTLTLTLSTLALTPTRTTRW